MNNRYSALAILAFVLSASGETTDEAPPAWEYSEHEDAMGRGNDKFATVTSVNAVTFGFPYAGEQHVTLTLQKNPKNGNYAILKIQRGQFLPSTIQNFITVRFDKGELQKFVIGDAADGSSDLTFIKEFPRLLTELRKAKTVKIEANFYREGSRVFEFDVHGLRAKW